MSRVAGHTLPLKGRVQLGGRLIGNGNGEGRAVCSCGEESPLMPSTRMRKMWHRVHKREVLARTTGSHPSAGDR